MFHNNGYCCHTSTLHPTLSFATSNSFDIEWVIVPLKRSWDIFKITISKLLDRNLKKFIFTYTCSNFSSPTQPCTSQASWQSTTNLIPIIRITPITVLWVGSSKSTFSTHTHCRALARTYWSIMFRNERQRGNSNNEKFEIKRHLDLLCLQL